MIIDWFEVGAAHSPDRACLDDGAERFTYREARAAIHRIAAAILDAAGENTKVGLYSPNCARALLAALGTFRAGVVYVPLNARDALVHNTWFLDFAGCDILFLHSSFEAHITQLRDSLPRLRTIICVDRDLPEAPSLETWTARYADAEVSVRRGPDDIAIIKSTGCTTGPPKGVLQTHRMLEAMYRTIESCLSPRRSPVHLIVAPITHAAGAFAYPLMAHGARQIFLRGGTTGAILDAIEREAVTYIFLPPTMIYRLLADPTVRGRNYSSLEYFIYAAAPMSTERLKEAIAVFGPVMAQCYGQAEAPMICTYLSPEEHLVGDDPARIRRLASAGRPTALADVAIMDDAGKLLPRGYRGEVVLRGDLVTPGYYRNAEASVEATKFGWHHSGDIGYHDDEGYLYLVDRKRDMIISGGFNVYPSEIEQVIWSHPAVQDCAVIGVPHEEWGEAVKAVVQLKPGMQTTEAELIALCRNRLGGIKTPKSIEFWQELPRSSVGKVLKREIRNRYWSGRERAI